MNCYTNPNAWGQPNPDATPRLQLEDLLAERYEVLDVRVYYRRRVAHWCDADGNPYTPSRYVI